MWPRGLRCAGCCDAARPGARRGVFFEAARQGGAVQQVHRLEAAFVEHGPVVEHAGKLLCLREAVHRKKLHGHCVLFAIPAHHFNALPGVGALCAVVDGKRLTFHLHAFGVWCKAGQRAVERKRKQLVAARRGIYCFETEFFCKGLVRKPGLLFCGAQHAEAGFPVFAGIGNAVLHQRPAVAFSFIRAACPKTVDINKVFALNGHPGCFQRGVFYKHRGLFVQLSEHVAFFQPRGQPAALGLNTGVKFFCADDAAQVLPGQVFRREAEKVCAHKMPSCLCFACYAHHNTARQCPQENMARRRASFREREKADSKSFSLCPENTRQSGKPPANRDKNRERKPGQAEREAPRCFNGSGAPHVPKE